MIATMFILGCLIFFVAYHTYGRFLNRQFNINDAVKTPAHTMRDGVDYVPARQPVLFGHHFSSIAGAGPIVGPVIAAAWFGWGPTLAWIMIGAIFVGGVHDYASLVMSIRHRARSIAEICRLYLNPVTYRFFLVFIWLALVYVLIVFLDLTATTFSATPEAHPHQGGTVATASLIYILLAVVFGWAVNRLGLSLKGGSFIFVPLVFLGLVAAHFLPLNTSALPAIIHGDPKYTWSLILIAYCFIASITPVWALLQPRDYLSSFLLFACLGLGGAGLLISSFTGHLPIQAAAFTGWSTEAHGALFPGLFIVVACGAVSGFHSIVASGTTSKQLTAETAARPIAYGSMLTEGVLALMALATVMVLPSQTVGNPMAVFAGGIGRFLAVFGLPAQFGTAFGLLAISTFLLTTLDTCTRLARYIVEEFFGLKEPRWRYLSTVLTLGPLFFFAFSRFPDPANPGVLLPAWKVIWPAFGTTNQLLAALALLVVVVWRRSAGKAYWFIALPMVFMIVTTTTSMIGLIHQHLFAQGGSPAIGWVNAVMMLMTVLLIGDTALNWRKLGSVALEEQVPAKEQAPAKEETPV